MANRSQLIVVLILTLTIAFPSIIEAVRSFSLTLNDVKCIVNENYVLNKSCTIDKLPGEEPKMNIIGQMKKAVVSLRVDYSVDLDRANKDSLSLFKITNLDGCRLMESNTSMPLMKLLRDTLLKFGSWPTGCPIAADYKFVFRDIVVNPEYLPPFVPEAEFKVAFVMYDRKVKIWHGTLFGKVTHQRKSKINKINKNG